MVDAKATDGEATRWAWNIILCQLAGSALKAVEKLKKIK